MMDEVIDDDDRFDTALEILCALIRHHGFREKQVLKAWEMSDEFFAEWEVRKP